jgi:hypothetical protein
VDDHSFDGVKKAAWQSARSGHRRHSSALVAPTLLVFLLVLSSRTAVRNQNPPSGKAPERFDMAVRGDMFSGMAGDREALERAMRLSEQRLENNSKDPEALVWHGSGLVFQAGQMFRAGDVINGKQTIVRGMKEMDDAVALEPHSLTTLIPRGASLLGYAAHASDPARARPRLEMGLADYEMVLSLQKPEWERLPLHSRGELLSGLAAGWLQAADVAKARSYAQRIATEMPGSRYAARAQEFLSTVPPPARLDWPCLGCHVSPAR